jgi:hypothetical protein
MKMFQMIMGTRFKARKLVTKPGPHGPKRHFYSPIIMRMGQNDKQQSVQQISRLSDSLEVKKATLTLSVLIVKAYIS